MDAAPPCSSDPSPLEEQLQTVQPSAGQVALFRFEQSHFIMKTSEGLLIHVDPFLSREVRPEDHIHAEPLIRPEKARADFVFITHDHRDHADPHTLAPLARANPHCVFVGPAPACERCRAAGVADSRIDRVESCETRDYGTFSVRVTPAVGTSGPDDTPHVGYVFDFEGVRIYHVGDTLKNPNEYAHELLSISALSPDAIVVPINRGYNNPGPEGAAWLVNWVKPALVVPCHYDCFRHNTIDPEEFVAILDVETRSRVRLLELGDFLFVPEYPL